MSLFVSFKHQWFEGKRHTTTVVQEREGGWTPPPPPPIEFLIGCSVSKRFYLQWEEVYFMGGDNAGGL